VSTRGDITWREPPTGDRVTYCSLDIDPFRSSASPASGLHRPSGW